MPNDTKLLTSYRFTFSLANYSTTQQHRFVMEHMRAIADAWPEFNVTTYQWLFVFGILFPSHRYTLRKRFTECLISNDTDGEAAAPAVCLSFLFAFGGFDALSQAINTRS